MLPGKYLNSFQAYLPGETRFSLFMHTQNTEHLSIKPRGYIAVWYDSNLCALPHSRELKERK